MCYVVTVRRVKGSNNNTVYGPSELLKRPVDGIGMKLRLWRCHVKE